MPVKKSPRPQKYFVYGALILIVILLIGLKVIFSDSSKTASVKILGVGKNSFSGEEKPTQTLPFGGLDIGSLKRIDEAAPLISAKSAIALDLTGENLLYQKSAQMKVPVASLVKIMTAVVALENRDLKELLTVSKEASSMEPDSMGLYPGEKLTLEQLLYGLLLVSGNDAAEVIAEGVKGDRQEFLSLMNKKAKELGMNDTYYVNPSGLQGDGDHYSTAQDQLILTLHALRNEVFRKIVATREYRIPTVYTEEENHKNFWLPNTSPLVDYPGFLGVKPGYTPEAGRCLITLVEKDRNQILVIVLGSDDRKGDTEALLDYSFKILGLGS
jgi:D-alanyl-D-alanine carboxypeptidase